MIVLDENFVAPQEQALRKIRIRARIVGIDAAGKGTSDENIIPYLLRLRHPTFFTRDRDFYRRHLCHGRYCLVLLDVNVKDLARFVRQFLRAPEFRTEYARMGAVVRVSEKGITGWRLHDEQEQFWPWP